MLYCSFKFELDRGHKDFCAFISTYQTGFFISGSRQYSGICFGSFAYQIWSIRTRFLPTVMWFWIILVYRRIVNTFCFTYIIYGCPLDLIIPVKLWADESCCACHLVRIFIRSLFLCNAFSTFGLIWVYYCGFSLSLYRYSACLFSVVMILQGFLLALGLWKELYRDSGFLRKSTSLLYWSIRPVWWYVSYAITMFSDT